MCMNKIPLNLQETINYLSEIFKDSSDIVTRKMKISNIDIYIVYTDGMIDNYLLSEGVLKKLIAIIEPFNYNSPEELIEQLCSKIPIGAIHKEQDITTAITSMLQGFALIFVNGCDTCISLSIPKYEQRKIEQPMIEATIKGPKDSFAENLEVNISLVRRRLSTPDFKSTTTILGKLNNSRLSLIYIDSLCNKDILKDILNRLETIKGRNILDNSYIEELIEDNPNSLYPTLQITERPDKVHAALLEGRFAILKENSPYAIIIPSFFNDFMQSPDDYYNKIWLGNFLRLLRYFSLLVATYFPAIYIASTTFNQEVLPTKLLITLQAQREGVPLPAILDILAMELSFEIIREAGIRLPKIVGPSVSIVGGLVLGDAAVRAGLVSPAAVVIIAVTGLTSFTLPSVLLYPSVIYIRFIAMLASAAWGFWGILMVFLLNLAHVLSLTSFGIPYFYPIAPKNKKDLKDIYIRPSLWQYSDNTLSIFTKKYLEKLRKK